MAGVTVDAWVTERRQDMTERPVKGLVTVNNRVLQWQPDGAREATTIDLVSKLKDVKVTKQPSAGAVGQPTSKASNPSMMIKWEGKDRIHTLVIDFRDFAQRDEVKDRILAARKQDRSTNDVPTVKVLPAELQIKARILLNNQSLRESHASLVQQNVITEAEFWEMHKDHLLNETQGPTNQTYGMRNMHYTATLNSTSNETQININLDKNTMQDILREHPEVKKAYDDNVPHNISEKKFFESFFASTHFRRTVQRKEDTSSEADIFKLAERALGEPKGLDGKLIDGPAVMFCADQFDEKAGFADGYGLKYNAEHTRLPPRPDMKDIGTRGQNVISKYNKHSGVVVDSMLHGKAASEGNAFREQTRIPDLEEAPPSMDIPLILKSNSGLLGQVKAVEDHPTVLDSHNSMISAARSLNDKYISSIFEPDYRGSQPEFASFQFPDLDFHYSAPKRRALDLEGNQLFNQIQEALRHYWSLFFDHQGEPLPPESRSADRLRKLTDYLTALKRDAVPRREALLVECIDAALDYPSKWRC